MKYSTSLSLCLLAIVAFNSACSSARTSPAGPPSPTPVNPWEPKPAGGSTTVTIDSADGLKLVGTLFTGDCQKAPGLLLLHQWQSDRHSYDDFAKRMQAKCFDVLSIDGRGFGESIKKADGSSVSAGRTDADVKAMLGDVDAAVTFLGKQPNVDPKKIAIVGASYGSSLAVIYAAEHPNVASVGMLSPGLNYFGNMQTEPAVRKYGDRPLYLVAAEDDKESADAVRRLGAIDAGRYTTLIYDSGGHGTALFKVTGSADKPPLANALESFLSSSLSIK